MNCQWSILLAAVAIAASARAQNVAGPFVGHVYDQVTQAIRPVIGIPGAAQTTAALNLCPDVQFAAVSPEQDYAVTICNSERILQIVRFGPAASSEPLANIVAAAAVSISPQGRTVAVFHDSGRTIDIITGLPDRASVRTVQLSGAPGIFAVADDGALLVATAEDHELLFIEPAGNSRSAGLNGIISAVRFRPGTHDAAVILDDRVVLLSDRGTKEMPHGSGLPQAIEFSRDGLRLFVATAREILAVSTAGESLGSAPVPCRVTALVRINPDSVLHVACDADPTLRIAEWRDNRPRVLFVPRSSD